ncbi:MAG: hypothetical protein F7C82_03335, partial [Desulfurococcales archaeon]|nr:hypothetical protein [Desulfurococcales archaeon]
IRTTITNIQEGSLRPTGPDLRIGFNTSFTVNSPRELRDQVKDKPLPPRDGSHVSRLDIWEIVDVVREEKAYELALYDASDGREYEIHVQIEVTAVARTLEYRDQEGNPIYFIRWSPCIRVRLAKK